MEQKFKSTIKPKDIKLYQSNDTDTNVVNEAGLYYPLLLINKTVIHKSDLISFEVTVGESFLPKFHCTINDSRYGFRETDFVHTESFITLRIANTNDVVYEPVQFDAIIMECDSEPGSKYVTFDCVMWIPKLYTNNIRALDKTSIEALSDIAKECGLGLFTNVSSTNDKMKWIQNNNWNIDLIKYIISRSYVSDDNCLYCYIDQYMNLCVIDMQKALSDRTKYYVKTSPHSGEKAENPKPIVLTNKILIEDNDPDNVKSPQPRIISWSPSTKYGFDFVSELTDMNYVVRKEYDYQEKNTERTRISYLKTNPVNHNDIPFLFNQNCHDKYDACKTSNRRNFISLMQGTKLKLLIEYYCPAIFCNMYAPVEIWESLKTFQNISSQDDKRAEDIEDEHDAPKIKINQGMTGDAIVISCSMSFVNKKIMRQNLQVLLLNKYSSTKK